MFSGGCEDRRYTVWVAFKRRGEEMVVLGVFSTRPEAKREVARREGISWDYPSLPDPSTWTAGGWTYEVREAVLHCLTRSVEVPVLTEVGPAW